MSLENQSFVVTGGGSGLGSATTSALLAAGAAVIVADLADADGHTGHERATFVRTDVKDSDSVAAAIQAAVDAADRFAGAVNCAGVGMAMKTLSRGEPHDLEVFRNVIEINLIGTFNVMRLAAVAMATQEPDERGQRGVLVNTASIAAFDGQIGQAAYSASKAGVAGMTLPVARDLARQGIRVMTIAPGLFDTRMLAMLPDDQRAALAANVPFPQRLGDPAEYARLVLAIIDNPMLNGEVIRLDGALRMPPR